MWLPKTFYTREASLDLSSSGQNSISVTELYADETRISNGVELNNWGNDPVQLLVCDSCGFVQCNSGNWVVLRRSGKYILFIPPFEYMLQGDWESDEFAPPYFIRKPGAIVLNLKQYEDLRNLAPQIPQTHLIKSLTSREIAWLMQWEAPNKVLGSFLEPLILRKKDLLATTQESDEATIAKLMTLLEEFTSSKRLVELIPIVEDKDTRVSFFFDGFEYTEWQPMARIQDEFHLMLAPGFWVKPVTD